MKLTLALLAVLAAFGQPASDLIPTGFHRVTRQTIVTNINKYAGYTILNVNYFSNYDTAYVVKDSVPLIPCYLGENHLYAIRTDLLSSSGGTSGLNIATIEKRLTGALIQLHSPLATDSDPLIEEDFFYRIDTISTTYFVLKLWKKVRKFNNSTPDSVALY